MVGYRAKYWFCHTHQPGLAGQNGGMRGDATDRFAQRGTSLEPRTPHLGIEQTPVDDFFVCKVGDVPAFDPAGWTLDLFGDGVERQVTASLADLQALPRRTVRSWLECAGNGRSLFNIVGDRPLAPDSNDTPWMLGAMGMATWAGPTLASVLELAGLVPEAAWVSPVGSDHPNPEREPVRMCLPMDKATHPDTIVALEMNGSPLEPMHGAPARLLVPGWVGAYSVKWLEGIEVSSDWINSWRADTYYRLRAPDGTDRGPATAHPVKSSLALDWPARLEAGAVETLGYARSGLAPITLVEWRLDGGPWDEAELIDLKSDWAWTPFRFEWEAAEGEHTISTRATDAAGNQQPAAMDYHPNGVLWNAVIPHPVVVERAS